jgi:hypothetical protein
MSSKSITGGAQPADEPLTLEAEAQQVLDKLWTDKLIPFELNVGKLTKASDMYIIHFHDSRIYTAHVPLTQGQSWKEMVRSAVLARVAKLSDPLQS